MLTSAIFVLHRRFHSRSTSYINFYLYTPHLNFRHRWGHSDGWCTPTLFISAPYGCILCLRVFIGDFFRFCVSMTSTRRRLQTYLSVWYDRALPLRRSTTPTYSTYLPPVIPITLLSCTAPAIFLLIRTHYIHIRMPVWAISEGWSRSSPHSVSGALQFCSCLQAD